MGEKPKILVITELRGNQMHTMRPEAELLISMVKHGADVTLMTNGDSIYRPRFEENGVHIIPFYPTSKFKKTEIRFVRDELKKGGFDILYLVTDNRAITTGILAAKGVPVKVVVYRGYSGNLEWYNPISYTKHLNSRVDMIICNGQAVADYFSRQLFFDKSKLFVFVKGHDTEWYRDVVPADLSEYSSTDNTFHLVWVGHNRQRMKGLASLLKGMTLIGEERDVQLHFIGSNTDTRENMAIIRDNGLKERVHLHGPMNDPRSIVAACDAFILPSVKGEACTRSVQEAMCMAVTPVISDIPGNEELIQAGISGLRFKAGDPTSIADSIIKIYDDREMNRILGEAAFERASTILSHEKSVEGILGCFRELID